MSQIPAPLHPVVQQKQISINRAARRLSHWAKQIVELGPQGSARYLMLDKLRMELNRALRQPPNPRVDRAGAAGSESNDLLGADGRSERSQ